MAQSRQVQLLHDAPVGRYVTTSFCKGQAQLMLNTHDARVGWTVATVFQRTSAADGWVLPRLCFLLSALSQSRQTLAQLMLVMLELGGSSPSLCRGQLQLMAVMLGLGGPFAIASAANVFTRVLAKPDPTISAGFCGAIESTNPTRAPKGLCRWLAIGPPTAARACPPVFALRFSHAALDSRACNMSMRYASLRPDRDRGHPNKASRASAASDLARQVT